VQLHAAELSWTHPPQQLLLLLSMQLSSVVFDKTSILTHLISLRAPFVSKPGSRSLF
jgi:hypothetical protein